MNLVVSDRAIRRLREISTYIQAHHPGAADDVRQAIRSAFTLIAHYPDVGRRVRPRIRRFVVPRLPYLVYYTVDEGAGTVTIITVRHAAQSRRGLG
ncbi:type II toxin-antitoxin system RelE/ParE family toxin [uncultured Methylobacterium sp.]|uniref:type II toxin-antitoxin system RelE/ParE family toxin n=1 Tax=uncultured Methylobacterium sp. TaxID=157278 RepID=UPI0026094120|nr:type II toxin-antitoxin system RelE/ParE family toxin [uncultured Methylobacterium sp.]